ncbi:MAG: ParB domain protein nuclease [Firmicutes bacterium]|nr:ParB domain protein nuclease [Bacillota bacterium]
MTKEILADGIPVYCAFDELADITQLVPNPRNPNQHSDKQIELLAKIIQNQGWRAPITVSTRSGFIVRGHGRLMAAQRLGVNQVPVDRQDYEDEASEWADLIADNKIAELSVLDTTALEEILQELDVSEFDMELTGFDSAEITKILGQPILPEEDKTGSQFSYHEQYGVIVICTDEQHQEKVYNELKEKGFECKVVCV